MEKNSSFQAMIIFGAVFLFIMNLVVLGIAIDETDKEVQTVDSEETKEKKVYDEIKRSLVTVYISNDGIVQSQGSGFIYDKNYIVTNHHVIRSARMNTGTSIELKHFGGDWSEAKVVGSDIYNDIAVIKFDNNNNYPSLSFKQGKPEVGSKIISYGSPYNYENSITVGHISGTERRMKSSVPKFTIPDSIQTDTLLAKGSSGGPLINMDREVIGVSRAIDRENIGLAVSNRVAKKAANEIIKNGKHNISFIGIQTREFNPAMKLENTPIKQGIVVAGVIEKSNAEGKLKESNENGLGDIITSVDGKEIEDTEDLSSYLLTKTSPGEEIKIKVIRNGEEKIINLRLNSRSNRNNR